MSERAPYVRFFPTDWKAGVAGLPLSVEWTYFQICIYNWDKGAPLPEALFEIVLGRNDNWRSDLELLTGYLDKIERTAGGGVFSARALSEANLAQDSLEKRRTGGKKGAAKRWADGDGSGDGIANGTPNGTPNGSPNGIPNGNQNQNQNQISPNGDNARKRADDGKAKSGGTLAPLGIGVVTVGDLVFQIDPESWAAFVAHRIKIKKPMTDYAKRLMLKKLERLSADGFRPVDVINQSIIKGWQDCFPVKEDYNGKSSDKDDRDGFSRALHDQAFSSG